MSDVLQLAERLEAKAQYFEEAAGLLVSIAVGQPTIALLREAASFIRNPSPAQGENELVEALRAIEIAKEALAHIGDPSFMRGEWSGDEMIYHWIGAEDFQVIARKALGRITALAQRATQESENG